MSYVLQRATVRLTPLLRTTVSQSFATAPRHLASKCHPPTARAFSRSCFRREDDADRKAKDLSQKAVEREERNVTSGTSAQTRENDRPWQRESRHAQPEATSQDPTKGDPTKGRLLTTPTRLLKLILPMPFHPDQEHVNQPVDKKARPDDTVEPLAILVHPQQPLSYLERLIQAEIPTVEYKGREKLPDIVFRAEADNEPSQRKKEKEQEQNGDGNANVAAYSGLGHEGPDKERSDTNWVRWSGSTEVGDFIRDAARGREFAINVEGYGKELRVAVPSFKDRTYYMRMRLRRTSSLITDMSKVKAECDMLAHKGAHRLAQGGFLALAGWWGVVYYVTFHTEMGWDLVEPVTYLAGLTTIMGAYLWFLYISRDLSYKAAMNVTVSKRQSALYQERGFDLPKWEALVSEANALRSEIKMIATEYDVEWDEMRDLGREEVKQVLEEEERDKNGEDKDDKPKGKDSSEKEKAKDNKE